VSVEKKFRDAYSMNGFFEHPSGINQGLLMVQMKYKWTLATKSQQVFKPTFRMHNFEASSQNCLFMPQWFLKSIFFTKQTVKSDKRPPKRPFHRSNNAMKVSGTNKDSAFKRGSNSKVRTFINDQHI